MSVESADDRATFLADFGTEVTWTLAAGGASTLTGIIEDAAMLAQGIVETGYVTAGPSLLCRTADIPTGGAQGDALTIDAVSWKAVSLMADGTGFTRVTLERAS
jgi:hypothetical protein